MSRSSQKTWYIYERGGVSFAILEPHFRVLAQPFKNKHHHVLPRFWAGFKGRHLYWGYGQPEFANLGKQWTKDWIKQGKSGSFFRAERKFFQQARKYALGLMSQPLPRSPRELAAIYKKLTYFTTTHTLIIAVSLDAFDETFPQLLASIVKNPEALAVLSKPAYRSVVTDYQLELLRLAISRKSVSKPRLNQLYRKYFWLPLGWSGQGAKTKAGMVEEITQLRKQSVSKLRLRQLELRNFDKTIRRERRTVIKRYGLAISKIKPYLDILDYCTLLHDRRKEIQMRFLFLLQNIRRQLAKDKRVPFKYMDWMTEQEIIDLIQGQTVPVKKIQQRQIAHSIMIDRRKLTEVSGNAALTIIRQLTNINRSASASLIGVAASKGKAQGRAVVTSDPQAAIRRMKRGNILVTSMTTPDFVPAMSKAAAIVTDEGGITSHAAIISRELGIPCVIGTKVATKVFKTGQTLFVDATQGLVKKL